jgi:hypothetical protein
MSLTNVSLKDYLTIGSPIGFLRMTSMYITGYKQINFTYWGSYGTWTLSSIIAILVYAITMWLLGSSENVGCGSTADKRKKVDCSMKCTSKLIYMRDMNVHVSV